VSDIKTAEVEETQSEGHEGYDKAFSLQRLASVLRERGSNVSEDVNDTSKAEYL